MEGICVLTSSLPRLYIFWLLPHWGKGWPESSWYHCNWVSECQCSGNSSSLSLSVRCQRLNIPHLTWSHQLLGEPQGVSSTSSNTESLGVIFSFVCDYRSTVGKETENLRGRLSGLGPEESLLFPCVFSLARTYIDTTVRKGGEESLTVLFGESIWKVICLRWVVVSFAL